jgi:hypothetical protein
MNGKLNFELVGWDWDWNQSTLSAVFERGRDMLAHRSDVRQECRVYYYVQSIYLFIVQQYVTRSHYIAMYAM